MYRIEHCDRDTIESKRKELKIRGYISANEISARIRTGKIKLLKYETTIFRRLKELAMKENDKYSAIYLTIEKYITRWWYREDQLDKMLKEIGAIE